MPGKLIVFEGVEGSGKTTQLQRTYDWLKQEGKRQCWGNRGEKIHIAVTREPGGTSLGQRLRQLLLAEGETSWPIANRAELLLYAADRAQHVEEFLKPHLAKGAIILCDRYTDSTVAYQGYGRGLDLGVIEQLNNTATGGLESDLTLWLDVDVEIGLERARKRGVANRMEQADIEFHRRVQEGFRCLYQHNPHRIVRVDASLAEDEVQLVIQEILCQRLSD